VQRDYVDALGDQQTYCERVTLGQDAAQEVERRDRRQEISLRARGGNLHRGNETGPHVGSERLGDASKLGRRRQWVPKSSGCPPSLSRALDGLTKRPSAYGRYWNTSLLDRGQ
jgi:hypothetical protein